MNNSGIFLKGLLIGGLVGSAVALLYAPYSGKKLRKNIRKKTEGLIEDSEKYLKNAKDKANHLLEDGIKNSTRIIDMTKKRVSSLI
jgi:gas vesicle protein